MVVDVACDSPRVQNQSGHKSAVPERTICSESGVDRKCTKAAGVFQADIERGRDRVEGRRRGKVGSSVNECGLQKGGGAGEEEAAIIWLVGGLVP